MPLPQSYQNPTDYQPPAPGPSVDWGRYWNRHDGCSQHDSCLTCPLPACVLEQPDLSDKAQRNATIWSALISGIPRAEIARQLKISLRQIDRIRASGPHHPPKALKASPAPQRTIYRQRRPLPELPL